MCLTHQLQLAQSLLSCYTAFFNSLASSRYLSFFSLSFKFILWSTGIAKSTILQILFFLLLIIMRFGLLAGIRWSVWMLKSHRSLCKSFSRTGAGLLLLLFLFLLLLFKRVLFLLEPLLMFFFSTGVWVTASLFKTPQIFLVFWPISTML